jgi:hypothetical protein
MALLTGRDLSTMQLNLLTERSRKFYDGTYKWISCEGFMDEEGGAFLSPSCFRTCPNEMQCIATLTIR